MCDPAVETLLKRFENFSSRAELTTAARALDRVIRHQYIVVPNWYADKYRVIYRNTIALPAQMPQYYSATDWVLKAGWVKR